MGLKFYKPTSAGRRSMTSNDFSEITKDKPEKSLLVHLKKNVGRNAYGRITSRHRGGGAKKYYRIIDFRRDKKDIPAIVAGIEYDPNRTANIALLHYKDGEKRYILAPNGLKVGEELMSSVTAEIKPGNSLPLKNIPLGSEVHNIELRPNAGGQLVRTAGGVAQLMAREGDYAQIRMPSGEVRMVNINCWATVGQVGNLDHENVSIGKAGRQRWMGLRPYVRGTAMNPVDHPHGGGEGKTKGGRHPVTPWGQPTKGYKTRKRCISDKYIIKRRKG